MLFNSCRFLLCFLPLSGSLYALVGDKPRFRVWLLLGLSLLFYGWWDPRFLIVLVGTILVNWLAARYFAAKSSRAIITLVIALDLLLLAGFKYADFLAANFGGLTGYRAEPVGIPIPLGISFFTFHHIMYLVDLRRRRAPLAPLDRYALYICFFPQAIAGPLARWSEVGAQFGRPMFGPGWEGRWALGITLIILGLIEKVALGDPLGRLLDSVYEAAAQGPVLDGSAWLAPSFALQIFFDFAGYSDIAIGIGLLFAVELPINFNAPFRARSIIEFWQRWHMTLARFLRDYVFLPVADMRIAGTRHTVPQYVLAIMVTMGLCGLWHGAGWKFVFWGLLQGAAMVFALGWRRSIGSPPGIVGWAGTMVFFALTVVLFRAGSLEAAWHVYAGLAVPPEAKLLARSWLIGVAGLLAVLLPASKDLCRRVADLPGPVAPITLGLIGVVILVQLGGTESYDFIYFQF
jgi:D-alanyl-lipoteichoic acid acyltransferase DltB (MBOAT superfamily)